MKEVADKIVVNKAPFFMEQNIKVAIRTRPLLESEKLRKAKRRQTILDNVDQVKDRTLSVLGSNIVVFDPPRKDAKRNYAFDVVFPEESSQVEVFEQTGKPLVGHVLEGFNATLFAYGATGCGKTFTITGTEQNPGIIYQTISELYQQIESKYSDYIVETSMSYLEVYNEHIYDLFARNGHQSLDIREDDSRIVVAGLSEIQPRDLSHMMKLLLKGNENRAHAFTDANANSSRSHAVLQIHVKQRLKVPVSNDDQIKIATLSIIDLAGSERATATNNKGERLNEGANINRSLLALGNCINALCSEKPSHIPFRNSKLTRLLKYSLNGNCKANVSPAIIHSEETHNTLKYANRAKEIKTKVSQNTVNVETHISQYPKIIEKLKLEVLRLRSELEKTKGIVPQAFDDQLTKTKALYGKLNEKSIKLHKLEFDNSMIDLQADAIKRLLIGINNATTMEQKRMVNNSILHLNEVLDHMHTQQVSVLHNVGEIKSAINRYEAELKLLQETTIFPPQLSSQYEMIFNQVRTQHRDELLQLMETNNKDFQVQIMRHSNLIFQKSMEFVNLLMQFGSSTEKFSQILFDYVEKLTYDFIGNNPQKNEITYDTCTEEDGHSDTTFTARSVQKDFFVETEEIPEFCTPRKKTKLLDKEFLEETPLANKRIFNPPKNTPRRSIRKTSRKPRMSMIPTFRK